MYDVKGNLGVVMVNALAEFHTSNYMTYHKDESSKRNSRFQSNHFILERLQAITHVFL